MAIAPVNAPTYHFNPRDSLVLAANRPARGCKELMLYESGDPGRHVLERHLGPGLAQARGHEGLSMALVDGCDHIVTPCIAQHRVRELITVFFDGCCPLLRAPIERAAHRCVRLGKLSLCV